VSATGIADKHAPTPAPLASLRVTATAALTAARPSTANATMRSSAAGQPAKQQSQQSLFSASLYQNDLPASRAGVENALLFADKADSASTLVDPSASYTRLSNSNSNQQHALPARRYVLAPTAPIAALGANMADYRRHIMQQQHQQQQQQQQQAQQESGTLVRPAVVPSSSLSSSLSSKLMSADLEQRRESPLEIGLTGTHVGVPRPLSALVAPAVPSYSLFGLKNLPASSTGTSGTIGMRRAASAKATLASAAPAAPSSATSAAFTAPASTLSLASGTGADASEAKAAAALSTAALAQAEAASAVMFRPNEDTSRLSNVASLSALAAGTVTTATATAISSAPGDGLVPHNQRKITCVQGSSVVFEVTPFHGFNFSCI
jgi:hypothetical protein